tara:strand:- start:1289 stop:1753 length:465 start_codon:yes stop_codon:yes gene_type:complete
MTIKPETWLFMKRIVRFGDTDSAGVMHFHQLLRWCHEAWEESLEKYGIPANKVFPNSNKGNVQIPVALPIAHCQADFLLPLQTGDHLEMNLLPLRLDSGSFQVETKFQRDKKVVAVGLIRHCAIDIHSSRRCNLPDEIDRWLEASSLQLGVTPL